MGHEARFKLAMFSPLEIPKLVLARWAGRRAGTATYQINQLYVCDELLAIKGKRVLEVGGSLPKSIVIDHYKARQWVCVDDVSRYRTELNWQEQENRAPPPDIDYNAQSEWTQFDGRIQDIPESYAGKFDLVFSVAVLEHINELGDALRKMQTALVPGGLMYHAVGPIWSGPRGHHVFPTYFEEHGKDAGARVVAGLRPWMHLFFTPDQMRDHLLATLEPSLADAAVHSIYESPRINRFTYTDYLEHFEREGLSVSWIKNWTKKQADTYFFDVLKKSEGQSQAHFFDVFSVISARAD